MPTGRAFSGLDRNSVDRSDGIPVTGGGVVQVTSGANITSRTPNTYSINAALSVTESYSYFYRLFSLGSTPVDDFASTATDAQEPTVNKTAYFRQGDLTIQGRWDIGSTESYVIFVDGNLTITNPGGIAELVTVAEGGFLAFIVSGNVTIDESVGHPTTTDTAGNVEGIFIADGTLTIDTLGAGQDKRFVGEGLFAAHGGVSLLRDYRSAENDTSSAEVFFYRPDFVVNVPTQMTKSQIIWQETN